MEANHHYIVGTAGHVDHGKTTLSRALTGVDTDRLKEEKERGLSIVLGFAPLPLPSGRPASLVDVPGHERFLRNMVAGVTSLDLVLLVVAADEGPMPQTREHLDVVTLLEAPAGLVALTKCDLVEPDWLELVAEELRETLRGTPFEHGPIVPCSGITGEGVERIAEEIDRLLEGVPPRDLAAPFKMAVDRVFTSHGFGTVVTGSVDRGILRVGEEAEALPGGVRARVRSIEVHGESAEEARAGQRAALNLQGVEREAIERGEVIAAPESLRVSTMLDVRLRVLSGAAAGLRHWERLRVHTGTTETLARLAVLGEAESIEPGEDAFAQLRLESPVAVATGERFVARTYSPSHTVAGGTVLDPAPRKHRGRERREAAEGLTVRAAGDPEQNLLRALHAAGPAPLSRAEALTGAGLHESEASLAALASLIAQGAAVEIGGALVARERLDEATEGIERALAAYHAAWPLRTAMPRAELRAALRESATPVFRAALEGLLTAGRLVAESSETVRLASFRPVLSAGEEEARLAALATAREAGLAGVSPDSLGTGVSPELLRRLLADGELIAIGEVVVERAAVESATAIVLGQIRERGEVRVGDVRDLLDSSRKVVVPFLEYLDARGVTRRQGDVRLAGGRSLGR